jgi:5-methylcytosine-specific restriction endonuclease McrA
MSRQVPEWIADHDDQDIPTRVKLRIFRKYDGRCYVTGRRLQIGEYDFDHIRPLSMGGGHRESNLAPIYRPAHREKTAEEAGPRAKADRIYLKENGLWPKSKRPPEGPGVRALAEGIPP